MRAGEAPCAHSTAGEVTSVLIGLRLGLLARPPPAPSSLRTDSLLIRDRLRAVATAPGDKGPPLEGDESDRAGRTTAPGEGERRAQRGYVPQYDLGARVIYEAMAAGHLQWIGLADRKAGVFDDVVLGLRDRIAAYQLKTSREPEPFRMGTILLGSGDLWARLLESRWRLNAEHPGTLIETIYACDDYPSTSDNIGEDTASSAVFCREHEAHRLSWTMSDWRASPFARFIAELQDASRLDDRAFEMVWRHTRFLVGGQARLIGLRPNSAGDERRLRDLAALLPRLVADPLDQDHWSLDDLLLRLNWRDPMRKKSIASLRCARR